jgi:hypothetical protein
MDTNALRSAHRHLQESILADESGFTAPPAGWDARRLLAHLAIIDELFIETTRAVLEGRPAAYDNARATFGPNVDTLATTATWNQLRRAVEIRATELDALAEQLTDHHANTLVHVRVVDGPTVTVDQPVPWGQALNFHATVHLPAHADDLRALVTH